MPLNDDPILSLTVDEDDDTGTTQEQINDLSLYLHDQNIFLEGVGRRVTSSFINHYMKLVPEDDEMFWEKVLRRMVKVYSLHNLKMYLTDVKITNMCMYTMELVRDMKIRIPEAILFKDITKNMEREELEKYLKTKNFGSFLKWCIVFIGRDSYAAFMEKLFQERFDDFYDGTDEEVE
jgi:hypothetical protein